MTLESRNNKSMIPKLVNFNLCSVKRSRFTKSDKQAYCGGRRSLIPIRKPIDNGKAENLFQLNRYKPLPALTKKSTKNISRIESSSKEMDNKVLKSTHSSIPVRIQHCRTRFLVQINGPRQKRRATDINGNYTFAVVKPELYKNSLIPIRTRITKEFEKQYKHT